MINRQCVLFMMGSSQIRRSTYSVCFELDAMQPCDGRRGDCFSGHAPFLGRSLDERNNFDITR
ncbi:hypothetical protein NC651_003918 [Populus alba x Populus x berolinensis]|nr:hypothetical protein NC651_003918 [Populus alba x Populus x berolinensis]